MLKEVMTKLLYLLVLLLVWITVGRIIHKSEDVKKGWQLLIS